VRIEGTFYRTSELDGEKMFIYNMGFPFLAILKFFDLGVLAVIPMTLVKL